MFKRKENSKFLPLLLMPKQKVVINIVPDKKVHQKKKLKKIFLKVHSCIDKEKDVFDDKKKKIYISLFP